MVGWADGSGELGKSPHERSDLTFHLVSSQQGASCLALRFGECR